MSNDDDIRSKFLPPLRNHRSSFALGPIDESGNPISDRIDIEFQNRQARKAARDAGYGDDVSLAGVILDLNKRIGELNNND